MSQEEQQPTAEALKQRRKREKAAAKDAALGVEKFTIEVAGIFKADLKRLMPGKGSDYVLCNALVSQKMLAERLFRTYFHRGKDTEYSSIL